MPSTFTYRTATISVISLFYIATTDGTLRFVISRSAGTTPPDGLLGPDNFTLEIGADADKSSFDINNPGAMTLFRSFSNHGVSWSVGDTVPVKLLRINTAPTVATVIPDQTADDGGHSIQLCVSGHHVD